MRYKFINRPLVAEDIINAVSYYKQISPALAKQFLFRIREARKHIAKYPEAFQIKYKNHYCPTKSHYNS